MLPRLNEWRTPLELVNKFFGVLERLQPKSSPSIESGTGFAALSESNQHNSAELSGHLKQSSAVDEFQVCRGIIHHIMAQCRLQQGHVSEAKEETKRSLRFLERLVGSK